MNQERMKSVALILLSLLLSPAFIFAQTEIKPIKDSAIPLLIKKRPWLAAGENMGVNIVINRFDANIRNIYWAKVTPAHWKANLAMGLQTDYDHFTTNWLGHPAHGSLFYNAARSNGFNYWQSIPFTVGGSLIWEYFGETFYASKIDFLTTSLGGVYLGEMTHRFSDFFKLKVKNKLLKTTAVTVINPMSQINSLLVKDKQQRNNSDTPAPVIKGQFSFGTSFPYCKIGGNSWGTRGYLGLSLAYGNPFNKLSQKYKPFDFFIFKTWLNFASRGRDSIYFNVSSHAMLLAKHLNKNTVLSVSQHYDHLASDVYKIGSMAVTGDYSFQHYWHPNNFMIGSVKAGVILFGASKSDIVNFIYHSSDPEFLRDYVYGNGFAGEAEILFKTKKGSKFTANANRWIIYTDSDTKGTEDLVLLLAEYDYPITRKLNIDLQANYYKRLANYDAYPGFRHIKNDYYEFKVLMSVRF